MNFQDLMNRATENSRNPSIQKKSGHNHKDNTPGISSSAVQAFLAKRQQQEQKRVAEQEAARRARVEARLEQSLQQKKGSKKKSTTERETGSETTNNQLKIDEEIKSRKPKQAHNNEHTRKFTSETSSYEEAPRRHTTEEPLPRNRPTSTSSKHSKKKAKPAPPNFKELLQMAERNKSGLSSKPAQKTNIKGRNSVEKKCDSKVKQKQREHNNHIMEQDRADFIVKHKKKDKKITKDMLKSSLKASPATSTKTDKHNTSSQKTDDIKKSMVVKRKTITSQSDIRKSSKPHSKRLEGRQSTNGRPSSNTNPYTESKPLSKEIKSRPYNNVSSKPSKTYGPKSKSPIHNPYTTRELATPGRPLKRHHQSYYDNDDDDMGDFIDDGDDGAAEDYSAHIREIFGYDRRRFDDEDFDDAAMESNYSQIEQEEHRSSKIAKLEDEIAFLKEQAELKREKERLMGKKKKKK